MNTETRYADGHGTLWSAQPRWLLLADDPGIELADELWETLHQVGPVAEDVLELLEKHYLGEVPALALLDLTPGATETVSRGTGRLVHDGDSRVLTVGDPSSSPTRLLLGGVVAAGSARIRELTRPTPRGAALIDGIPEHILAASAPDHRPGPDTRGAGPAPLQPAPAPPPQSVPQSQPQSQSQSHPEPAPPLSVDHDGDTRSRPRHARHHTSQTVLAVACADRHLSPSYATHCRVCEQPVPAQEPHRVPLPRLGILGLPTGEVVPLDRGVVFGRKPGAVLSGESYPHLVHLPARSTYLSRMHLQIELEGWSVIARDLGSQGGTRLLVPGRAPELIRPHEAYTLEPGSQLDLADVYPISFDQGS